MVQTHMDMRCRTSSAMVEAHGKRARGFSLWRPPMLSLAACLVVTVLGCGAAVAGASVESQQCSFPTQHIDCGGLSCNRTTNTCAPCRADADCFNGGYTCTAAGRCEMIDLFSRVKPATIIVPFIAVVVCAIAVVAGVGGGAILVPVYALLLSLPISDAVGLSQATILGQSVINVAMQLGRHHPRHAPPNPTRPLINWEYLLLLAPFLMVGTMVGSIGNKVSPGWFRVALLAALVSFVPYRLVLKTVRQRQEDRERRAAAATDGGDVAKGLTSGEGKRELTELCITGDPIAEPVSGGWDRFFLPSQAYANGGKPQYPCRLMIALMVLFAGQLGMTVVESHTLGLIRCGGAPYWALVGGAVGWSFVAFGGVRTYLGYLRQAVVNGRAHPSAVPFVWNRVTTVVFPITSFVAGSAAAMLGVGGGMILSFLLLEANLAPEEVSATGGIATLLVASQSILVYLAEGSLAWDYALLLGGAGVVSTLVGQFGLVRPIRRRGHTFLFIAALVAIMAASLCTLGGYGMYESLLVHDYGGSLAFGALCKAH